MEGALCRGLRRRSSGQNSLWEEVTGYKNTPCAPGGDEGTYGRVLQAILTRQGRRRKGPAKGALSSISVESVRVVSMLNDIVGVLFVSPYIHPHFIFRSQNLI